MTTNSQIDLNIDPIYARFIGETTRLDHTTVRKGNSYKLQPKFFEPSRDWLWIAIDDKDVIPYTLDGFLNNWDCNTSITDIISDL